MDRLLIAVAIVVAVATVALIVRQRRPDAPMRSSGRVPEQLDRADFADAAKPWLVAVFTSATCETCRAVQDKAEVLVSDDVAVDVIEYQRNRDVHSRYHIDAVPLVVIADSAGVVRYHVFGPVTATDLWAAVAAARDGAA